MKALLATLTLAFSISGFAQHEDITRTGKLDQIVKKALAQKKKVDLKEKQKQENREKRISNLFSRFDNLNEAEKEYLLQFKNEYGQPFIKEINHHSTIDGKEYPIKGSSLITSNESLDNVEEQINLLENNKGKVVAPKVNLNRSENIENIELYSHAQKAPIKSFDLSSNPREYKDLQDALNAFIPSSSKDRELVESLLKSSRAQELIEMTIRSHKASENYSIMYKTEVYPRSNITNSVTFQTPVWLVLSQSNLCNAESSEKIHLATILERDGVPDYQRQYELKKDLLEGLRRAYFNAARDSMMCDENSKEEKSGSENK